MSRFHKIYVDSRHKINGSDSDFDVELPEVLECSPSQVVYVTGVSFPNVFWSIEQGVNDRFYLITSSLAGGAVVQSNGWFFVLAAGNYSGADFASAVAQQIDQAVVPNPAVSYVSKAGQLLIVMPPNMSIRVPSDAELGSAAWKAANWDTCTFSMAYDPTRLLSMNEVLRNTGTTVEASSYLSNLLSLRPFHTLYLYSNIANYDSTDSVGKNGILRRIPVTSDFGYVCHDQGAVLSEDYVSVGNRNFKVLHFSLRDSRGTVVDLHGSHISFELCLAEK